MKQLRCAAAAFFLLAWAPAAQAGVRDEVLSALMRCASLPDDYGWLDCYEAAARNARTAHGAPARNAAAVPAAPSPLLRYDPAPDAGARPLDRRDTPVTSRITNYAISPRGYFTVTLNNGQVWEQLDGDSNIARLFNPPTTYTATVQRNAQGYYILNFRGVRYDFRVHRIK